MRKKNKKCHLNLICILKNISYYFKFIIITLNLKNLLIKLKK